LSVPSNSTSTIGNGSYTAAVTTYADSYFAGTVNTTNLTTLVNEVDFVLGGVSKTVSFASTPCLL